MFEVIVYCFPYLLISLFHYRCGGREGVLNRRRFVYHTIHYAYTYVNVSDTSQRTKRVTTATGDTFAKTSRCTGSRIKVRTNLRNLFRICKYRERNYTSISLSSRDGAAV